MAAATGRDKLAAQLPLVLAEYLQLRRRLDDMLTITVVSAGAARRLGDGPHGELCAGDYGQCPSSGAAL